MSGHSKWSTIKRKKGALDAKRSKIFSKLIKEITVAVKEGGADPDGNPRLRVAIANAKSQSMPKDNITRAISKGSDKDGANYQEVTYEGYAPNAVAIFVECTTDNTQRTVSNIRSYFNKYNGSLGTNGSLSFIFTRKGIFEVQDNDKINKDDFELEIIDAGAEDISLEDGVYSIITAMENFGAVSKKLDELNIETIEAGLQRIPNTYVKLDVEAAKKIMNIIEIFEDDDDVINVFHNLELTDELLDELSR